MSVKDWLPVALAGAVLPGNFKVKKSKLRGVVSDGMMCSARELQLGDDHRGILILQDRPAVGTPINEVFPQRDLVFDIEVTPNRPDCLSRGRTIYVFYTSLPEPSNERFASRCRQKIKISNPS